MKSKIFLRPSIAIVFVFIGAYIARSGTPPEIFAITGNYFTLIAALSFGTLGFILPDIAELAGKAGINVLARELAERIPDPRSVRLRSRLPFPRRNAKATKYESPIVVDTSVLIDGRVLEIAKTGFINGTFLIIPSVVGELHKFADSPDTLRRKKGRRGLDILGELRKAKNIKLEVLKSEPKEAEVDDKLVALSKKIGAKLMTLDYNLNKVGRVRGLGILNINELTNAVKTAVLPNDNLEVTVREKGKERGQGVGYLPDGTMVVVEHGADYVGRTMEVVVRKVIQTNAGKMIFARRSTKD